MAAAVTRSAAFEVQQPGAFAVQLRLTPALLEALLAGDGSAATICFGGNQQGAINVGDSAFPFRALPEESCDLLRLPATGAPPPAAQPAALLGAVRQKLMLQRNIADERERVRARAEEAERRGHERGAVLLQGGGGPPGRAARAGKPTVQRTTPPPPAAASLQKQQQQQARRPTPPPGPLTAAMLVAPAGRPPTHPASLPASQQQQQQPRARSVTPPPGQAGAAEAPAPKPMHKSASTSRLPGGGAGGGAKQAASALVLQAARSGSGLRLVLIAMLSERQMGRNAVNSVIADVAQRVRAFKAPSKPDLERQLKAVAEYRSPGVYVLWPQLLRELEALSPGGAGAAGSGGSASPPAASGQSGGAAAGKKRLAKAGGGEGAKPAAAAAPVAGSKRTRFADWSDDDDSGGAAPVAPALRLRAHAQASAPAALAVGAAAAAGSDSPPSVGLAGAAAPGSGGGLRRTSSSRGSDKADEAWIEEHADRQPEPAAPIASREEYAAREAAFNAKYELYFALHQLIEAHKKDFEALAAAQAAAPSPAERDRLRCELERLHARRGERAKRWDQAYRVLHQELSAAKQRMAEFVQAIQQQRQQQQQQQQQAGSGGAPPPPPVRVS